MKLATPSFILDELAQKEFHLLVLLLDYDGTLVPIQRNPERAILSETARKLLYVLAHHPKVRLAVMSGRSCSDLKKLVRVPDVIYVGNHGAEICMNNRVLIDPQAKKARSLLKAVHEELGTKLRYLQGVFIEDKGLTLTVHYRNMRKGRVKDIKAAIAETLCELESEKKLEIRQGKKSLEIRPLGGRTKGGAALWIVRMSSRESALLRPGTTWRSKAAIIAIGDDRTDEDMFRDLPSNAITIHVGKEGQSSARFRLKSPRSVRDFLAGVERFLME
ncbi:MAG: trehalose-phosphatase [Bacteroidota bacterium]